MIKGDSEEYDLLEKWAKFDCQGHYSCEIGVRQGLGSKIIMDNVTNNYMHVGIDPYGCLLYTSPSPRDRQKSRMPSSA